MSHGYTLPTLGLGTLFALSSVVLLPACRDSNPIVLPAAELEAPDGYTAFLSVELHDGIRVQLSVPTPYYEADPTYYDQISVQGLTDEDALADFGTVIENPLGVVFSMSPGGLEFEAPLYLQVAWTRDGISEREGYELRLITKDDGGDLWRPIAGNSLDLATRTTAGWVEHFSSYAFAWVPRPIKSLSLLDGAVEGSEVVFQADGDFADVLALCSTCTSLDFDGDLLRITAPAGKHSLMLDVSFYRNWDQDFYVAPNDDYALWSAAASRFQPLLRFSENRSDMGGAISCEDSYKSEDTIGGETVEPYRPQSLGSIFHPDVGLGVRDGFDLDIRPGHLQAAYMSQHGNIGNILDQQTSMPGLRLRSGIGVSPTIYWQVETDVDVASSVGSALPDRVFITYWMFYPWDWKSPDLRAGKHSLDRESLSIELSCPAPDTPESCVPQAVWYAGHLPGQYMYLLNPIDVHTVGGRWEGDALRVPWEVVERDGSNEDSPIGYVAYGSHALYPRKAVYYVDPNLDKNIIQPPAAVGNLPPWGDFGGTEAACGDPDAGSYGPIGSGADTEYELLPLDMKTVRSDDGAMSSLLFSGKFVDGITNGQFPPFVDRFHDLGAWATALQDLNNRVEWCYEARCLDCVHGASEPYCINDTLISCNGNESTRVDCSASDMVCEDGACTQGPPPPDPTPGRLIAAAWNGEAQDVIELDPAAGAPTVLGALGDLYTWNSQMAISPDGHFLYAIGMNNSDAGRFYQMDLFSGDLLNTVSVDASTATAVLAGFDASQRLIALRWNGAQEDVGVLDTGSGSVDVIGQLGDLETWNFQAVISRDGSALYALGRSGGTGRLYEFSLDGGGFEGTVSVGGHVDAALAGFDSEGRLIGTLWNGEQEDVLVIDPSTGQVAVLGQFEGLYYYNKQVTVDPSSDIIYAFGSPVSAENNEQLYMFDLSREVASGNLSLGNGPIGWRIAGFAPSR